MRSIPMPRRSHHTDSLDRLNKALGLANGTPLSERMAIGTPRSRNSRSKAVKASSSRVDSSASHMSRKREGLVGDGERIAVAAVAELEFALEIGTPEIIGRSAFGQRRAARTMARPAAALDQGVAIEHGMDSALRGDPHVTGEPAHQQFADLACTPMRLLPLEPDDQALDRRRQL